MYAIRSYYGLQASGVFGTIEGDLKGIQTSGVFSTAKTINGLQASGVFSTAKTIKGLQASGVFNYSETINGGRITSYNVCYTKLLRLHFPEK